MNSPENSNTKIQVSVAADDVREWAKEVNGVFNEKPKQSALVQYLVSFQTLVKDYWLWFSILFFILAWFFFGADPSYLIKKWAVESKQINAKLAQYEYSTQLSNDYIALGESFLDSNKFKDAENAFEEALDKDQYSIKAQYGLMKSHLLNFSETDEFDPEVIRRRIDLLERVIPKGQQQGVVRDAHLLYAKGKLFQTVKDESVKPRILFEQAIILRPEYAVAYGELGLIALQEKQYDEAIDRLTTALDYSKYQGEYVSALSYAHEQQGDHTKAGELISANFQLDQEIFASLLSLLRHQLIYQLNFSWVEENCSRLPVYFETNKLHKKTKNQQAYGVFVVGQYVGIQSWEAKKSYCQQLKLLAQYFMDRSGDNLLQLNQVKALLEKNWSTAEDGVIALPVFFINDLNKICQSKTEIQPLLPELQHLTEEAQDYLQRLGGQSMAQLCNAQ